MIEVATGFPFLGSRNYVHGTSIVSGFLDVLEDAASGSITIRRLKLQRPARSNGRLVVTASDTESLHGESANGTLLAKVGGETWRGTFTEGGSAITRRAEVSYDISEVQAQGFGGTCVIAARDREDLVRTLVEANKRFHEASATGLEEPVVRFGYVENWGVPPRDVAFASVKLTATNLIARKTDEGYMTINRLAYTPPDGPTVGLTLCFNVEPARTS